MRREPRITKQYAGAFWRCISARPVIAALVSMRSQRCCAEFAPMPVVARTIRQTSYRLPDRQIRCLKGPRSRISAQGLNLQRPTWQA